MALVVATYFWSDPSWPNSGYYTADNVRELACSASKNLTVPYEFVVVTDKPEEFELDAGIRAIEIDWEKHVPGKCFVRLMTFHPDGRAIFGADRIFQVDLDTMIVGNFDHVVSREEDVVLWRNPARVPWDNPSVPSRALYNGSFVLHKLGSRPDIWNDFDPEEPTVKDDQEWYSAKFGEDVPFFDRHDGIYRVARPGEPETGIWGDLPDNACLVTFAGSEGKPDNPVIREANPWIGEYEKQKEEEFFTPAHIHENKFITFASFLWSDPHRRRDYKFTEKHAIILRNMLKRCCNLDHEFVIVTDCRQSAEILSTERIRCVPLDMSKHVPGTCAAKLMARRPDIGGMLGRRIALLDLDIVLTGNVDDIFGREEANVMYRNPNYRPGNGRAFYQGSIQLFNAGVYSYLYTEFNPDVTPGVANRRFGGMEQAWISERLSWSLPYWDQTHGIYGAGRLFNGNPDGGIVSDLPENARIVVIPGNREPSQDHIQKTHEWIKEFYW